MQPAILSLTESAADRLRALSARNNGQGGLRLSLKKGGCAGMEYAMAYAEAAMPGDEVISSDGATLYIDRTAVLYLIGTVMDWRTQGLGASFVFDNPNMTSACGCGESVALTPGQR